MASRTISVIKVRDILLVTVPAEPDDPTISELQEAVVGAMERHQARGLILDIATVETIDSFFARTITETVRMVALMGGLTVLAGMRACVAITTTQLGLNLGPALTALDVDRALDLLSTAIHPHEEVR